MGIKKFLKDGGLFGKMRGFDSDKEEHWYGFDELKDDFNKLKETTIHIINAPKEIVESILDQKKIMHIDSDTKLIE